MAEYRCPACGAYITTEGRFCSHCGAKIDDGVQRSEIRIDQHIQNDAEVRRAQYEEQESQLRQQQIKGEIRSKKAKHIILFVLLGLSVLCLTTGILAGLLFDEDFYRIAFTGGICSFAAGGTIISQLINGKW